MATISVVITTYNEAEHIENCLKSVTWADEILIVDLGSTDATIECCARYTDRIISHPLVPVVEMVRDFTISQAQSDWVLVMDPDERASKGLGDILRQKVKKNQPAAYSLFFITRIFGKDILHTGWGEDEHIRFFSRVHVKWPATVHSCPVVDGDIEHIPMNEGYIIHENYSSISHFIEKLNRYTTAEAQRLNDAGRSFHWLKLFYQPSKEFWSRFIRLKGYKDGLHGLFLSLLMAFYTQASYMKLWEIERKSIKSQS